MCMCVCVCMSCACINNNNNNNYVGHENALTPYKSLAVINLHNTLHIRTFCMYYMSVVMEIRVKFMLSFMCM